MSKVEVTQMEKLVVVNGATTKCTGSGQSSFLLVPPDLQIEIDGLNPATIAHHKPGDNIVPFGPCKFLNENPCAPVTPSPWDKGEPSVPFGAEPSLNTNSCLRCKLGGEIELLSSGQGRPFFSTDNENLSLAARLHRREFYDRWLEGQKALNDFIDEWVDDPDVIGNTILETGKEFFGDNPGELLGNLTPWKRAAQVKKHGPNVVKELRDEGKDATNKVIKDSGDEALKRSSKADRIKEHLTKRDGEAARREANGEVVARKPDGTPRDHVSEVKQAQRDMLRRINSIRNGLQNPNLTPERRQELIDELSVASRELDRSERYLPR